MTEYTGSGSAHVTVTVTGSTSVLALTPQGINYAYKYLGEPNVPKAVTRRRRSVYDAMRRLGTPFLYKHRWTDNDVGLGLAMKSPAFDDTYGTSVTYDAISHGTGFVSQAMSPNEWYDKFGTIVQSSTSPGPTYTRASMYRGYGPGWLVWCIQTDSPTDYLKLDEGGTVVRVQEPQIICPWFPTMEDGDLLISVQLDAGLNILRTFDIYELKKVRVTAVRGYDKSGRRESRIDLQTPYGQTGVPPSGIRGQNATETFTPVGNAYGINQISVQNRLPLEHVAYSVETDR